MANPKRKPGRRSSQYGTRKKFPLPGIACLLKKRYVIRLGHPEKEEEFAVKCVSLDDVREGEKHLWFGLRHQNIVPLLIKIAMPQSPSGISSLLKEGTIEERQ